jgi:hypothetical protein
MEANDAPVYQAMKGRFKAWKPQMPSKEETTGKRGNSFYIDLDELI